MNLEFMKEEVDNCLKGHFQNKGTYNKHIYDSMYYSIECGGKRIRPLLMLLTYGIYKKDYKNILPLACAIEMIHTYSLIHDDLPCMDNDDLRRGKPTNHKVFGEAVAVLAGDGLLNEAMSVMFDYCLKNPKAVEACDVISKAAGSDGMIGGQIVDILSENKNIQKDELMYMHKKKTGELIKAPIISGAILGGADKEEIQKLSKFGEKIGLAFQIKDDILDIVGNTKLLGKNVNSDGENHKTNFITTFGIEKCKEMCVEITKECLEILHELDKNTSDLEDLTMFLLKRNY
ncbi:polyprenyl synthetase family protein [Haloimpatiens sp. FM7330]|uniref:polyprenyl synthetase family protein n=1 Tax=Haloimpatiens sp. FM7330 TaxID=3298610 RepID=UPI00362ADB56